MKLLIVGSEVELVLPTHQSQHTRLHHTNPLFGLLRHTVLVLSLLSERVLDGKAPDINVITYRSDDIELEKRRSTIGCAYSREGNVPQSCHKHQQLDLNK